MPNTEFVDVEPDIRLQVRDWGPITGKVIVLIPGWPLSHEMYEYQFTELSKQGFRCVGITMRGFGKSSKPWGEYNYDIFADDIKRVMESLDLHDVTLGGHSMGGAIAIRYITRHKGDRVLKLALFGAAAPSFVKRIGFPYGIEKQAVDDLIALCGADRAKLNENFGDIFFRDKNAVSPKLAGWFHNMGMTASPYATEACLIALRDADLRAELELVDVPTVIFHGEQDKICPIELAEALTAGIKNSKLIRFQNSGHGLFYEEKNKFNTELMNFTGKI